MQITIDTQHTPREEARDLVIFLIHLFNLDSDIIPAGTKEPCQDIKSSDTAKSESELHRENSEYPAANPEPSNVLNFPVPPPPPNFADTAAPATPAPPAITAVDVGTVVSGSLLNVAPISVASLAEYDSAGMPWDERIHQKGKSRKKDGTWKLKKGPDPATVQAVTIELYARKISTVASPVLPAQSVPPLTLDAVPPPPVDGAVPPPPPVASQVSLPNSVTRGRFLSNPTPSTSVSEGNPVPLSPVSVNSAATYVPPQPVPPPMPVPPVPAVGPLGVSFRSLIDKMTAGTKTQTLTADKVLKIVQSFGCPNLQHLNQMPHIFADVDAQLELALAGL